MQAHNGDHITVGSRRVGQPDRHGVIVDVRGTDGQPPYMVVWDDRPGEHLVFPGSDASITPAG